MLKKEIWMVSGLVVYTANNKCNVLV